MDITSLLYNISNLANGVFDFVAAVAIIVIALTAVRKADPTLGYVLASAMGVRFLTVCCIRAGHGATDSMGGSAEAVMTALGLMSLISAFIELGLWVAVGYCLFALAKKIAP